MPDNRQLFLLGQKLFRLKDGFSTDQRKDHACGASLGENAWVEEIRFTTRNGDEEVLGLVDRAQGHEPWRRVALICDAGLGKTTNMQFLQAHLAARESRQVPVLIRLDTSTPEESHCVGVDLLKDELRVPTEEPILNWLVNELFTTGASGGDDARCRSALRRLQANGRISLLVDGLDHAANDPEIVRYLKRFLEQAQWRKCPIWISGRPTAFQSRWRDVFSAEHWKFVRVAPLSEPEIRFYMTQCAGGDWYDDIPEGGRHLLSIPRFLRLVCGVLRAATAGKKTLAARRSAVKKLRLTTPADVYSLAYLEVGNEADNNPDPNSLGLLAQGLKGEPARIGLTEREIPSAGNRRKRVERTAAILGAIAFEMMFPSTTKKPAPRWNGAPRHPFQGLAATRFQSASVADSAAFDAELELLLNMNVHSLEFLVFKNANDKRLAFRDRTTMAYFAAHWACFHAKFEGDACELDITRKCVVDDLFEKNQEFREFWQFAAEMPDTKCFKVDQKRWLALFTPLFDGSVTDAKRRPIRSTEFIYRAWPRMAASPAGRKVIREKFQDPSIPQELLDGFIPLVRGLLPGDSGTFLMGDGDNAHRNTLTHFCLHKFCVTNAEYERFEPRHQDQRWRGGAHRAVEVTGDDTADDSCPAVMVSWYDAWCFAKWLGTFVDPKTGQRYELCLPNETQWEYACRAGKETRFTFDGKRADEVCTPAYCNFDGNHPDAGQAEGEYRKCTVPVDGSIPPFWQKAFKKKGMKLSPVKGRNIWGFFQLHGNVGEWCADWYDEAASFRVLRGGGWLDGARFCRSAFRVWFEPDFRSHFYGFRLAAVPCTVGAQSSK